MQAVADHLGFLYCCSPSVCVEAGTMYKNLVPMYACT